MDNHCFQSIMVFRVVDQFQQEDITFLPEGCLEVNVSYPKRISKKYWWILINYLIDMIHKMSKNIS